MPFSGQLRYRQPLLRWWCLGDPGPSQTYYRHPIPCSRLPRPVARLLFRSHRFFHSCLRCARPCAFACRCRPTCHPVTCVSPESSELAHTIRQSHPWMWESSEWNVGAAGIQISGRIWTYISLNCCTSAATMNLCQPETLHAHGTAPRTRGNPSALHLDARDRHRSATGSESSGSHCGPVAESRLQQQIGSRVGNHTARPRGFIAAVLFFFSALGVPPTYTGSLQIVACAIVT